MTVNIYGLRMGEDRRSMLVKESAHAYGGTLRIDSDERAAKLFDEVFEASKRPEEHFWMMTLDGKRNVTGMFEVTVGTLMSTQVHPREVYLRAALMHAASIIVCHNHPSGDLGISPEDTEATQRLKDAGEIMGIQLDDHIIIACGDEFEFCSVM